MATTNYVSANGMIVGESTGGVSRAYGTDALGSVVATYSGAVRENTYQYKPYGGLLSKTGVASDPSFLWNGGSGYRPSGLAATSHYIRGRHYSGTCGRWTSLDPLWPKEGAFVYTSNRPTNLVDPTGLRCQPTYPPPSNSGVFLTAEFQPQFEFIPAIQSSPSECNGLHAGVVSGWCFKAHLIVTFTDIYTSSPCTCPAYGNRPRLPVNQWKWVGPLNYSGAYWESDGSQSCGPAIANGCSITQLGRDAPGLGAVWWIDRETNCDSGERYQYIGLGQTLDDEVHFRTFANEPDDITMPYWDKNYVAWGYIMVVSASKDPNIWPLADIQKTSP